MEAFGKTKDSMGDKLALKTQAAWVDADGNMPERIECRYEQGYSSNQDVLNDFLSRTAEAGRYHISWAWHGKKKGHIITMETLADGSRRFYDPQTGLLANDISPWAGKGLGKFDLKTGGINAYRVDNLQPNALVVSGLVKEAGSEAATPNATYKQLLWWNASAKKTKSGSANAATPLTPEERARRSEIKEEAKKILHGIEMRNAEFGKPITISNNSIKEWTNQPFTEYMEKNEALLVLPKLIKEAKYLGYGADKHDPNIKAHFFQTEIGKTTSWIIVREMKDGCHVHSVSDKADITNYITKRKG